MAYSSTSLFKSVFGNLRVVGLNVTLDAVSGALDTGLTRIIAIGGPAAISMVSAGIEFAMNQNSGTTALGGSLLVKSASAGDNFHLVVYGR